MTCLLVKWHRRFGRSLVCLQDQSLPEVSDQSTEQNTSTHKNCYQDDTAERTATTIFEIPTIGFNNMADARICV